MFRRLTKKKSHAEQEDIGHPKDLSPSVIASNVAMLGNIISDGILDIDGRIDGNVRCHSITLRPNGHIHGDLMAHEVHIHGTVDGLIKAQNVTLYATARVHGTVMHESITIEDGALVDGKLKRTERLQIEHRREDAPKAAHSNSSSSFFNDNEEKPSEAEIKILDSLRLIN